jgi:outer membrane protein TolC
MMHAIAVDNLAKLEASTAEEVRAALRAERAATEGLALAKAQEETAIRARSMAENQFSAGTATSLDVEDAQSLALQARVGRIRAEAAWLGARWQRMRLCGEGIREG